MPVVRLKIRNSQSGATLIEVMVALLVLAIGLLGFAGMQTKGIVTGRQAYLHSTAAFLAEDMAERIRANVKQAASYSMAFGDAGQDNHCDTTNCTDAQMIQWDQFKWQSQVAKVLPNGFGQISTVQGSNAYVTATIKLCYMLDTSNKTDVDCDAAAAETSVGIDDKKYIYTLQTQIYYSN